MKSNVIRHPTNPVRSREVIVGRSGRGRWWVKWRDVCGVRQDADFVTGEEAHAFADRMALELCRVTQDDLDALDDSDLRP